MFGRKNGAASGIFRREAIAAAEMLGARLGIIWVSQKSAENYAAMIREWLHGKKGAAGALQAALPEDAWDKLVHLRQTNLYLLEGLVADILD